MGRTNEALSIELEGGLSFMVRRAERLPSFVPSTISRLMARIGGVRLW